MSTPIVERFETKSNLFTRLLFAVLMLLSILTLAISLSEGESSNAWWGLGGMILFGMGALVILSRNIVVMHDGFSVQNFFKKSFTYWGEITGIILEMEYHGHGAQMVLKILSAQRSELIHVRQFQRRGILRFMEILDEQCVTAEKNEHFLKFARGQMDWKSRLKMWVK